jgi:hypothetical protein
LTNFCKAFVELAEELFPQQKNTAFGFSPDYLSALLFY